MTGDSMKDWLISRINAAQTPLQLQKTWDNMAYKYHIDPDVLRAWHRRKGELAGK